MTTIHYSPPPDDAPEMVLAWNPDVPDRWFSHPSDWVRCCWGNPWAAWCEQPPLPTPEPEEAPHADEKVWRLRWPNGALGLPFTLDEAHEFRRIYGDDDATIGRWDPDDRNRWIDAPGEVDEGEKVDPNEPVPLEVGMKVRHVTEDQVGPGPSDLLPLIRPGWEQAWTAEQIRRACERTGMSGWSRVIDALRDGEGE